MQEIRFFVDSSAANGEKLIDLIIAGQVFHCLVEGFEKSLFAMKT